MGAYLVSTGMIESEAASRGTHGATLNSRQLNTNANENYALAA
jgi:hypothetical protein